MYLHQKELAHRDIKPDNILIQPDDTYPLVKVTDFSFTKDLSGREGSDMSTIRGNIHWMAPELLDETGQYVRNHCTKYNRSVDIYSLGLVFAYACMIKAGWECIKHVICE